MVEPTSTEPSPRSGVDVSLLRDALDMKALGVHAAAAEPSSARRRASVAAIFASGNHDTELLFIQRAAVDRDPWSGQMAFPGGRVEPDDIDSFATAERETLEEIGIDLGAARRLGSLAEVDGGRGTNRDIVVSGHCYWLSRTSVSISPNHEVADVLWVPVGHLLDDGRYIEYRYPRSGARFPGIQLDNPHQVIWGLTLRFLADLMVRLERPFII